MAQDTTKKVLSLAMGTNAGLNTLAEEAGRIVFVTDTGKMYIDVTDESRVAVNAANADYATKAGEAGKWSTARTITVGSTGKSVDGSAAVSWTHAEIGATVSNTWTGGTTAGPTLSTTVNGVTGTAVAIPAASSSASGVVTTGNQTFKGTKTFSSKISGSITGNADGTAAGWTTARTFTINGAASADGVPVDGKAGVALNLPLVLSGFTSVSATKFIGALEGNADTATTASKTTGTLTIKGNGTSLGTFNGSANKTIDLTAANVGALSSSTLYAGSASAGGPANSVKSNLTIGGKTYNGSEPITIQPSDLGLTNALDFIGVTTTTLTDGNKTITTIKINNADYAVNIGDVVLNGNKEFVWTGTTTGWKELGDQGSFALKTITITGTGALSGGGSLAEDRTITHTTYNNAGKTVGSSSTSIEGSGASGTIYIPQITVDTYGHITYNADTAVAIKMPTLPTLRNFTVATSTEAASAATSSVTYDPDGSAAKTFTIYKMKGASTSAAGYQGLVPAPATLNTDAASNTIYTALLGDGTWGEPSITWSTF